MLVSEIILTHYSPPYSYSSLLRGLHRQTTLMLFDSVGFFFDIANINVFYLENAL